MFVIFGVVADMINYMKFHLDQLRGFDMAGIRKPLVPLENVVVRNTGLSAATLAQEFSHQRNTRIEPRDHDH